MPHDVCEIEGGKKGTTVRVDNWDSTGRHWLYYFRKSEDDTHYTLDSTASVPYEGDRIETEFGIDSAEEKMEDEGYSVSPYNNES